MPPATESTTRGPDLDLALREMLKPRDHAQRRRLAAARGPEEAHKLAVADLEVESRHGVGRFRSIALLDATEVDLRHVSFPVLGLDWFW